MGDTKRNVLRGPPKYAEMVEEAFEDWKRVRGIDIASIDVFEAGFLYGFGQIQLFPRSKAKNITLSDALDAIESYRKR